MNPSPKPYVRASALWGGGQSTFCLHALVHSNCNTQSVTPTAYMRMAVLGRPAKLQNLLILVEPARCHALQLGTAPKCYGWESETRHRSCFPGVWDARELEQLQSRSDGLEPCMLCRYGVILWLALDRSAVAWHRGQWQLPRLCLASQLSWPLDRLARSFVPPARSPDIAQSSFRHHIRPFRR